MDSSKKNLVWGGVVLKGSGNDEKNDFGIVITYNDAKVEITDIEPDTSNENTKLIAYISSKTNKEDEKSHVLENDKTKPILPFNLNLTEVDEEEDCDEEMGLINLRAGDRIYLQIGDNLVDTVFILRGAAK